MLNASAIMLTCSVNTLLFARHNICLGLTVSLICQHANMLISPDDRARNRLMGMPLRMQVFSQKCWLSIAGVSVGLSIKLYVLRWLYCMLKQMIHRSTPPFSLPFQMLTAATDSCWLRVCRAAAHFWSRANQIKLWPGIKKASNQLPVMLL